MRMPKKANIRPVGSGSWRTPSSPESPTDATRSPKTIIPIPLPVLDVLAAVAPRIARSAPPARTAVQTAAFSFTSGLAREPPDRLDRLLHPLDRADVAGVHRHHGRRPRPPRGDLRLEPEQHVVARPLAGP